MRESESKLEYLTQSDYIFQRELFYLWVFLAQEDLLDDATEFMEAHRDTPTPYEIFFGHKNLKMS